MRATPWQRLFPAADFRWSMGLAKGDAVDFFAPGEQAEAVLHQRRRLLESEGEHYALLPPAADDLVEEALARFASWSGRRFRDAFDAGATLEPDWVLLRPDDSGRFLAEAGIVCFPSGWSLPAQAGRELAALHAPVPGLNEALAARIDAFLSRLAPGTVRERDNWGLAADPDLDHHPRHPRRHLRGDEPFGEVWLRRERQLFDRLPGGGILFGIRVEVRPLSEAIAASPPLAAAIARALRTLPEAAALYKGLAEARHLLADRLGDHVAEDPAGKAEPGSA